MARKERPRTAALIVRGETTVCAALYRAGRLVYATGGLWELAGSGEVAASR